MNEKAGLYFHIPFCKNKCPYCDFFSAPYSEIAAEAYSQRIIEEIKKYRGEFDTVYFGGGTPSLLPPAFIAQILSAAKNRFSIDSSSEITIECNPRENLTEAFKAYRAMGINRISLGMQSAVDKERRALGRASGKPEVKSAILAAKRAGIENISLDLMLGIPHQTLDSLEESLDFIDSMQVTHVSAYMLKIEENTPFFQQKARLALPDEDAVAEMYLKTVRALEELGLAQYEISNFAKDGYESRHNLKYWQLTPYLGFGKSAHSFWKGKRFYYDGDFNKTDDGEGGTREERIMLGLRLTKGIEKSLIEKPYAPFVAMGLLRETKDRIALTATGMLVSNSIINSLL